MANYFNHHHPPLPQQVIQHKSHPWHPLILLSTPPYYGGGFTCDACRHGGHDFTYHCPTCHYDLHVGCASLPETVIRGDHQHPLTLFYCGYKEEGNTFICDVCHGNVPDGCWIYYCKSCDYGTHLGCATAEASPVAEEEEGTEEYSMAEAESRLKLLQLQMQLAQQNAESQHGLMDRKAKVVAALKEWDDSKAVLGMSEHAVDEIPCNSQQVKLRVMIFPPAMQLGSTFKFIKNLSSIGLGCLA
ncbi:hypothetical protein VitviT2T_020688 [Vitis vinifera]|uniref:DC1 domain-containing protein n=1 Tax=Vitis vinifera TaxID=29760 RepID=A0ABY9D4S0_VITVI|nr:hypothetical protein VitviT2T_020688 [Vitis vinifera]